MGYIQRVKAWLSEPHVAPFVPNSLTCMFEGYSKSQFLRDIIAGITVGIISIPFALALAAAAGLDPIRGLYTAIIAGFLTSLFGGSNFLVAGPTGALIVIIFNVVQKFGYDGLLCASLEAALILILLGCFRCGRFVKYIPYPVVMGFSLGIAIALIISQIKDFFGLDIPKPTIDIVDKIGLTITYAKTINLYSTLIASFTLAVIIILRRYSRKLPGAAIALVIVALVTTLFHIPVETIESKFGAIPAHFPPLSWPHISFDLLRRSFPTAIGIALIAAIESLVAAVAVDSITGTKHRSNAQLIAQGLGNLGSALFGGIPATSSLTRTSVNVQMNAQTPMAGIVHSLTILGVTILCAPLVSKIPLPALSAVLVFIGWNMFDFEKTKEILKGYAGEAIIMLVTLVITIFVDLNTAVQTGILISIVLFLKRSSDTTSGTILLELEDDESPESQAEPQALDFQPLEPIALEPLALEVTPTQESPAEKEQMVKPADDKPRKGGAWKRKLPDDIKLYEIEGPFFFAVTDLLSDVLNRFSTLPRILVVRMRSVPFIDSTGVDSLKQFSRQCDKKGVELYLAELKPSVRDSLDHSNFFKAFPKTKVLTSARQAIHFSTLSPTYVCPDETVPTPSEKEPQVVLLTEKE